MYVACEVGWYAEKFLKLVESYSAHQDAKICSTVALDRNRQPEVRFTLPLIVADGERMAVFSKPGRFRPGPLLTDPSAIRRSNHYSSSVDHHQFG